MIFHKFQKIDNLEKRAEQILCHNVVVTEKIHGTSFRFVFFNPKLCKPPICGSRNRELLFDDTTFYSAAPQTFAFGKWFSTPNNSFIWTDDIEYIAFYGEWAGKSVMPEVKYGEPNFYCYQTRIGYNTGHRTYEEILLYKDMKELCLKFGLDCVPLLASGKLTVDTLKLILRMDSFILKDKNGNQMPNNQLEGVVITTEPHIYDADGDLYMVKFKNDRFKEHVKVVKPKTIKSPAATLLAEEFVTKGRILNIISHGDFNPSWDIVDMKYLSQLVPADIKEEEKESWEKALEDVSEADVRSAICRKTVSLYKDILLERSLKKESCQK